MKRKRTLTKVTEVMVEQQGGCSGLPTTCDKDKLETKDVLCKYHVIYECTRRLIHNRFHSFSNISVSTFLNPICCTVLKRSVQVCHMFMEHVEQLVSNLWPGHTTEDK